MHMQSAMDLVDAQIQTLINPNPHNLLEKKSTILARPMIVIERGKKWWIGDEASSVYDTRSHFEFLK